MDNSLPDKDGIIPTPQDSGSDDLAGNRAGDAAADPRSEVAADDPRPGAGSAATSQPAGRAAPGASSLFAAIALYTLLRLALVAALTAVLMIFMPLIVALLFAIIVQLPLSWLLFAGPRRKVNEAIAQASEHRRSERTRLQSALRGDDAVD